MTTPISQQVGDALDGAFWFGRNTEGEPFDRLRADTVEKVRQLEERVHDVDALTTAARQSGFQFQKFADGYRLLPLIVGKAEPLGEPFSKVLDDNLWNLYADAAPSPSTQQPDAESDYDRIHREIEQAERNKPVRLSDFAPKQPDAPTVADYESVLADHRRLVRELDVLLNGEDGAAKQASLCDIVGQVRREGIKAQQSDAGEPDLFEWLDTEVSAIDCMYRGDPSYGHDAYWMRDRVLKLVAEAREIFAAPAPAPQVEQPYFDIEVAAQSIASMVTEWVKDGPRGADWTAGLPGIIARRLKRFIAPQVAQTAEGEGVTYRPNEKTVRAACELVDRIKGAYSHWGGWSATPDVCDDIVNMLRYPVSMLDTTPPQQPAAESADDTDELMRLMCEYEEALEEGDEEAIAPKRQALTGFLRPILAALSRQSAAPPHSPIADKGMEDEDVALDLLETLFSSYENGTECYEDPDDQAGFLGYCFHLEEKTFDACVALLNRRRPRAALAAQPKGDSGGE